VVCSRSRTISSRLTGYNDLALTLAGNRVKQSDRPEYSDFDRDACFIRHHLRMPTKFGILDAHVAVTAERSIVRGEKRTFLLGSKKL
jgi:hypothetical protein